MSAPTWRATLRYGAPRRYHLEDVTATSLREALQLVLERWPADVQGADLIEIRQLTDPEQRSYTPA